MDRGIAISGSHCWQFNWLSIVSRMLWPPKLRVIASVCRFCDAENCYQRNSRMCAARCPILYVYYTYFRQRSRWWRHSNEIKSHQMAFMLNIQYSVFTSSRLHGIAAGRVEHGHQYKGKMGETRHGWSEACEMRSKMEKKAATMAATAAAEIFCALCQNCV